MVQVHSKVWLGYRNRIQAGLEIKTHQKNPKKPKKTHLKKPAKNVFLGFFKFLIFYENNSKFSL
jgi:hypothetical protein